MNISNESYWHKTAFYKNLNTKNISGKKYDVLIVGAGLTGLNTAFLLMNKGLKVAVVDSSKVGYGVSGFSSAKITLQHGLIYDYLIRNYGLNYATNYYKANHDGINFYKSLIRNLNIPCDFQEDKSIIYSKYKDKIYEFKSEAEAYDRIGLKYNIIDEYDLEFPIKCGLEIEHQYKFNPLKYLYYLAEYIGKNGIDIFENTKVINISVFNKPYKIYTDKGEAIADNVIIATHFPFKKILGMFYLKQYQEKSYIIACKTAVNKINGMFLGIDKDAISIRFQKSGKDNILLIGGQNHKVGDSRRYINAYRYLEDYLIKYFSKYEILSKWSTQDCMSNDRIPFIGSINKFNSNIYVATGYSKWGMTSSAAAAIILSNTILNSNKIEYYDSIFTPYRHLNLNATTITNVAKSSYNTFSGYAKRFLINSMDIKNLKNESATIVSHNTNNIGVYLDNLDKYHCIKPYCTHLGCSLSFNDEDKTWECKCHGSRYNIYGEVIEGPANKNLKYTCIEKKQLFKNIK